MREMTIMQRLMENKWNTNNKRTTKVETMLDTMLDTMKMVSTQLQHGTAAEKHCLGLYPGVLYSTNNATVACFKNLHCKIVLHFGAFSVSS